MHKFGASVPEVGPLPRLSKRAGRSYEAVLLNSITDRFDDTAVIAA
jgi:hypothetical protein